MSRAGNFVKSSVLKSIILFPWFLYVKAVIGRYFQKQSHYLLQVSPKKNLGGSSLFPLGKKCQPSVWYSNYATNKLIISKKFLWRNYQVVTMCKVLDAGRTHRKDRHGISEGPHSLLGKPDMETTIFHIMQKCQN